MIYHYPCFLTAVVVPAARSDDGCCVNWMCLHELGTLVGLTGQGWALTTKFSHILSISTLILSTWFIIYHSYNVYPPDNQVSMSYSKNIMFQSNIKGIAGVYNVASHYIMGKTCNSVGHSLKCRAQGRGKQPC